MASVTKSAESKQPAQSTTSPLTIDAVAAAVLAKMAGNEPWRDELAAGSAHTAELTVTGKVDNQPIEPVAIKSILTIGHDSQRASSSGPDTAELVGCILMKLNEATRNSILRELPAIYAEQGCELPVVPREIAAATDAMLKSLRSKKQIDVRGSVSCKYSIEKIEQVGKGRKLA